MTIPTRFGKMFKSHQPATARTIMPSEITKLMSTPSSSSSLPGCGIVISRDRYKVVLSPIRLSGGPRLFLVLASAWSMNSAACVTAELQTPQPQVWKRLCRRQRGAVARLHVDFFLNGVSLIAGGIDQWQMVSVRGPLVTRSGWSSMSGT